jgi:hypothetical protein
VSSVSDTAKSAVVEAEDDESERTNLESKSVFTSALYNIKGRSWEVVDGNSDGGEEDDGRVWPTATSWEMETSPNELLLLTDRDVVAKPTTPRTNTSQNRRRRHIKSSVADLFIEKGIFFVDFSVEAMKAVTRV